jgi:hypothetical protein
MVLTDYHARVFAGVDFKGSRSDWRDVGCGNGLLLSSLMRWSGTRFAPMGFDVDASRIVSARRRFIGHTGLFFVANMFEGAWSSLKVDTILAPWAPVSTYIDRCCSVATRQILFYVYDDQPALQKRLQRECLRAGLNVTNMGGNPPRLTFCRVCAICPNR